MLRSLIQERNNWHLSINLFSKRRQATISGLVHHLNSGFVQHFWISWKGEEGLGGAFLNQANTGHAGLVLPHCQPLEFPHHLFSFGLGEDIWGMISESSSNFSCWICSTMPHLMGKQLGEEFVICGVFRKPACKCNEFPYFEISIS